MTLRDKYTQEINYLELGFIIVCSAILKSLWMIYIDNLAYRVIGLNRQSAYHNFIVAMVATVIFLCFISIFNNASAGFSSEPPDTPDSIISSLNNTNNTNNTQSSNEFPITNKTDNIEDTWYLEPLRIESLYVGPSKRVIN